MEPVHQGKVLIPDEARENVIQTTKKMLINLEWKEAWDEDEEELATMLALVLNLDLETCNGFGDLKHQR